MSFVKKPDSTRNKKNHDITTTQRNLKKLNKYSYNYQFFYKQFKNI
jgi:hypothetical protein